LCCLAVVRAPRARPMQAIALRRGVATVLKLPPELLGGQVTLHTAPPLTRRSLAAVLVELARPMPEMVTRPPVSSRPLLRDGGHVVSVNTNVRRNPQLLGPRRRHFFRRSSSSSSTSDGQVAPAPQLDRRRARRVSRTPGTRPGRWRRAGPHPGARAIECRAAGDLGSSPYRKRLRRRCRRPPASATATKTTTMFHASG